MLFHYLLVFMGLLAITATVSSLSDYSAEAQTIPIPELKPKVLEIQEPPRTDFAMKVQLEPDENKTDAARGEYQVSNFALAVSNSSDLCLPPITIPTCEFDLEGELWSSELTPDMTRLDGTLEVDTGDSTRELLLHAEWPIVEESKPDGQTVQAINGTLDVGTDMTFPEYQSQINGTLASNGTSLILEAHGIQPSADP
jgi:hypothetical protein